jgi:hypothetical protein
MFMCGFLAIIGLFPAVLMNHVSELYLYNSIPFFSILVGCGIVEAINLHQKNQIIFGIIAFFLATLLAINIVAIHKKSYLMKVNGDRASSLIGQIMLYVGKVPQDSSLLLMNPSSRVNEYSIFIMNGFNVLQEGLNRIGQLSKTDNLKIDIITGPENIPKPRPNNAIVLALDRETGDVIRIH